LAVIASGEAMADTAYLGSELETGFLAAVKPGDKNAPYFEAFQFSGKPKIPLSLVHRSVMMVEPRFFAYLRRFSPASTKPPEKGKEKRVSDQMKSGLSRRELMKKSGQVAAASALAGVVLPQVHAGENNIVQIALVGCGGRGTGAASNALNATGGPTRLVAMADVFQNRLNGSYENLNRSHGQQLNVPQERRFIGFDGYRRAMDALRVGDVVILATPPAFRWAQFAYAIEKRLNVFMEKPITVDGPSTRRMLRLGQESVRAGLKVGVGLMCRHCEIRQELFRRIKDGQMGDITMLRAYRMAGPTATAFSPPKPDNTSELAYQIQRFHSFLWASGGAYSDFLIHNIDECCWMKDAWPVSANSSGGRHYRGNYIDQNFDSYSTEFTFADGARLFLAGRIMPGCHNEFASYAHGTRGSAIISRNGHTPARCRMYRGQNFVDADLTWRAPAEEPDPYQLEWNNLFRAIRRNQPYNEVERGAMASLVTAMGRMSAHTGQVITREQMLAHDHEFAPNVDQLTLDGPAPLRLGPDGKYPVPQPGIVTRREY
jgi:predicted dehydrogenase